MTTTENTTALPTMTREHPLYGVQVATNYQPTIDAIGEIEQSMSGNTVLRIGQFRRTAGGGWEQTAHVVLEPEERDDLIAELIRQRDVLAANREQAGR